MKYFYLNNFQFIEIKCFKIRLHSFQYSLNKILFILKISCNQEIILLFYNSIPTTNLKQSRLFVISRTILNIFLKLFYLTLSFMQLVMPTLFPLHHQNRISRLYTVHPRVSPADSRSQ